MYGIVLARRDFREADQVITILTAEEGKREYIARGVKKIISKNTAHLEPCSLVSFGIAQGKKEFSYLTNVQPVEAFPRIRTSLQKLHIIGYSLDAMLALVKEGEEDSELYYLYLSFLKFLNASEQERLLLLDALLIKLFSHLGYHPAIDACVVCDKSYTDIGKEFFASGQKPGWYFSGGGIVCSSCFAEKKRIEEQLLQCGLAEINTLDFLLRSEWQDVLAYEIEKDEYKNIHRLIYEFVLYHSERKWQDWGRMG